MELSNSMKWMAILVGILIVTGIYGVSIYNNLISVNEDIDAKWSQIENQLQRRSDLIPNLVEILRAYASQEKEEILTNITEAHAKLASAQTIGETAKADADLSGALSRLSVVAERYPELKSDANFRQLAGELDGSSKRLTTARRDYNEAVRQYNTRIKCFPGNVVAGIGGFHKRTYFEAAETAREVPK